MPLDEFISTQDHPLILQVCHRVLGLHAASDPAPTGAAPAPLAEMLPGGVQWPGRDPYPTYFASSRSALAGPASVGSPPAAPLVRES
jgi:hypothetical protein